MTPVPPTRHSYNHTRQAVKEKNLGLRAAFGILESSNHSFYKLGMYKKAASSSSSHRDFINTFS